MWPRSRWGAIRWGTGVFHSVTPTAPSDWRRGGVCQWGVVCGVVRGVLGAACVLLGVVCVVCSVWCEVCGVWCGVRGAVCGAVCCGVWCVVRCVWWGVCRVVGCGGCGGCGGARGPPAMSRTSCRAALRCTYMEFLRYAVLRAQAS